jgi:hypothetical protein
MLSYPVSQKWGDVLERRVSNLLDLMNDKRNFQRKKEGGVGTSLEDLQPTTRSSTDTRCPPPHKSARFQLPEN